MQGPRFNPYERFNVSRGLAYLLLASSLSLIFYCSPTCLLHAKFAVSLTHAVELLNQNLFFVIHFCLESYSLCWILCSRITNWFPQFTQAPIKQYLMNDLSWNLTSLALYMPLICFIVVAFHNLSCIPQVGQNFYNESCQRLCHILAILFLVSPAVKCPSFFHLSQLLSRSVAQL